ncbi:MAG: hypothetical protein OHK0045_25050 [Raineya sp.]
MDMKQLLLFIGILLSLHSVNSSYAQFSSLSFENIEGEPFFLYVNGNLINENPDTYASVNGLWDGIYWIRIIVNPQSKEAQIIEKKIPLLGLNISFVVRKKRGKYRISLQGIGNVGEMLGMNTRIYRNPREQMPTRTKPKPDIEEKTKPNNPETDISDSNPMPTDRYSMRVLDSEFEEIKKHIQEEISDEQKVRVAKFSMKNTGYFSSEQVAELVSLISFDKEKLELAKFAYEYTYDRYQYYTKVSRSLKTNESKKELFDYLESK